MCPSTWIPPPGTSGGSTSNPPSPDAGWRSWAAPASSSASCTGAHTGSGEASLERTGGWCVEERKERETETENQYIHRITQCTHFLAVWPYLITDIEARARTMKALYIFPSVLDDRRMLMPVFLNKSVTTGSNKASQYDSYANKRILTSLLLLLCPFPLLLNFS